MTSSSSSDLGLLAPLLLKNVPCPYGCGADIDTIHGLHLKCPSVNPDGSKLPGRLVIDIPNGRNGGLPENYVKDYDTTGQVKCGECLKWVKTTHRTCGDGIDLPEEKKINVGAGKYGGNPPPVGVRVVKKASPKVYNGWVEPEGEVKAPVPVESRVASKIVSRGGWQAKKETEIDYSKVVYWLEPLKVGVGGQEHQFATISQLAGFFMCFRYTRIILTSNPKWFPALTAELLTHDIKPTIYLKKGKYYTYEVKGSFSCKIIQNYAIADLNDFVSMNQLVHMMTGMNSCLTKTTLAQLAYDYWFHWKNTHRVEILRGDSYRFACSAYYSARICSTNGVYVSRLTEEIEAGKRSYESLLADVSADIRYQLDVRSMYPTAMRGMKDLEVKYPIGTARYLEAGGGDEFEKGTVGMYRVEYIIPPGLRLGVLPAYVNGNIQWPREMGVGSAVFTNVDIQLGMKYGYSFVFSGECLVWDNTSSDLFSAYVDQIYELRQNEVDPVKRGVLKHMLVVLYGKMAQKATGSMAQNNKALTEEEIIEALTSGKHFDQNENGDYIGCSSVNKAKENTKPNHLGCFILSYSRVLMMKAFDVVGCEFDFSHTDSLRVSSEGYHKLVKAGLVDVDDKKMLGSLGVDHGLIYYSDQRNKTNYQLKVLTAEGVVKVINKGKSFLNGGEESEDGEALDEQQE